MNGRGPVRPRRWQNLSPLADWGSQRDVMNGRGLVQPCRLQNLSLLEGARGDVMTGHWCDQAEIMESIAAQGRPRGCYDVVNGRGLVRPGRLQNLLRLGCARGDVMNRHWCDQAEIMESIAARGHPRGYYDVVNGCGLLQPGSLQNSSPLGDVRGDVMNGHWCDQAEIMESIAAQGHPRGCYDVMNGHGLV